MRADDSRGAAAYDSFAAEYATANETAPYNALYERPAVIELLGDVHGRRVLDVGCGSGTLSQWLVESGASVVGFDISPAMLAIARERGLSGASFHVADLARPLTFVPDASFDLAVASLVFHYLRDWAAPLRELSRGLVPGGTLVLSTHHPAMDVGLSAGGDYFGLELVQDRWDLGGRVVDVQFWRRPLSAMFASFTDAGFSVEGVHEPMPVDACRTRFPEAWEELTTKPSFVFFRLAKTSESRLPAHR
ncbi:MAG: class I SAM-dependent methyltransferase [Solirubrobacteraceae bacterium]